MSKKEGVKKGAVSEIQKNVSNELEKIKDTEKEHKAELESIKIEHANEVQMSDDQKCYLIQISTQNLGTYVSKKVPRDKTLTAVFDGYLDDILYPATIVGKRVRYPVGKTRIYKVIVDPLDKELVESRIPAITACYKAITNRKLEIEFQK